MRGVDQQTRPFATVPPYVLTTDTFGGTGTQVVTSSASMPSAVLTVCTE